MKSIVLTDSRPVFQGDIRMRLASGVPLAATEIKGADAAVVAHSETGHHHILVGDFTIRRVDGMTLIAECRSSVVLKHLRDFDTHEELQFDLAGGASAQAPMFLEIRRQREHTPEGWRRVED